MTLSETATADGVSSAYSYCEALTRTQAANFYYGIRLLSPERRRAMCAAYAFSRQIDDIGDGSLAAPEKLRLLDAREAALGALGPAGPARTGGGADPVIVALGDACARFPIPVDALGELIEGVRMDVLGVGYEAFDELVLYCRRVAGAIGRVCLAIFALKAQGPPQRERAQSLADDLGVALQLTNILRDVREDAENGRVYLPGEDLRRFGLLSGAGAGAGAPGGGEDVTAMACSAQELSSRLAALADTNGRTTGARGGHSDREQLAQLVRFEAARAREWFARGGQLAPLLDRRSAACLLAMAGIYRRLLLRIEAEPLQAMQQRVSLPAHEKAWVAVRGMLGAGL